MLVVCALLGTVMAGVLSLLMVGQQSATHREQGGRPVERRMGIDRSSKRSERRATCRRSHVPGRAATPCPPYNYAFSAISAQTATALTIQNDWNAATTSRPPP